MGIAHKGEFFYEDLDKDGQDDQMEVTVGACPIAVQDTAPTKHTWGPVCGTRQSARINYAGGMIMMQMVQKITTRRNLEAKAPAHPNSKVEQYKTPSQFFLRVDYIILLTLWVLTYHL